jgi:hypothetical protein
MFLSLFVFDREKGSEKDTRERKHEWIFRISIIWKSFNFNVIIWISVYDSKFSKETTTLIILSIGKDKGGFNPQNF